jgi:hypothetical protein
MRRLSVSTRPASGWVRTRPRRGSDGPHAGPARAAGPGGGAARRTAARAIPGGGWTSRRATSEAGRSGLLPGRS